MNLLQKAQIHPTLFIPCKLELLEKFIQIITPLPTAKIKDWKGEKLEQVGKASFETVKRRAHYKAVNDNEQFKKPK